MAGPGSVRRVQFNERGPGDDSDSEEVISITSSSVNSIEPMPRITQVTERHELMVDGYIVVFTDGACKDNQYRALRRAGIGGYWADNHPFNFGVPLETGEQTNNRAEMAAVMRQAYRLLSLPLQAQGL